MNETISSNTFLCFRFYSVTKKVLDLLRYNVDKMLSIRNNSQIVSRVTSNILFDSKLHSNYENSRSWIFSHEADN